MTKHAGLSPENKLLEMRPAAANLKDKDQKNTTPARTFKLNPFSPFAPPKPIYERDDKYDIGEDAWWNGMVLPARDDAPMIVLSGFAGLSRPGEGRPMGFYATLSRPSAKKGIGIDSYALLRYAEKPSTKLERPSLRPHAGFYVQRSPAPKNIGKPAPVPTLKAKTVMSVFSAPSGASARSNLMVPASYLYSGQKRPEVQ